MRSRYGGTIPGVASGGGGTVTPCPPTFIAPETYRRSDNFNERLLLPESYRRSEVFKFNQLLLPETQRRADVGTITLTGAPVIREVALTTQTGNSTSVVMTLAAPAVAGDYLIVNICSSTVGLTENFTAPAGWSLSLSSTHINLVTTPNLRTYTKLAGASEPSTYTWTNGANVCHVATIIRLTGVNQTTPINVSAAAVPNNTNDPVSPTILTTQPNCFIFSVCSQFNALEQTYTPPAGYTERADQTGAVLGVAQVTSELATRTLATAGLTGTATHDSSQLVASTWLAHHMAIQGGTAVITV